MLCPIAVGMPDQIGQGGGDFYCAVEGFEPAAEAAKEPLDAGQHGAFKIEVQVHGVGGFDHSVHEEDIEQRVLPEVASDAAGDVVGPPAVVHHQRGGGGMAIAVA